MAEHTIPVVDGGSIPTPSLQDLWVEPCSAREAADFVATHHYKHSTHGMTPAYSYQVVHKKTRKMLGAAMLGIPGQLQTLEKYGVSGSGEKLILVELQRLVLLDECPKNSESTVLGVLFRLLRARGVQRILSFADPNEKRERHPDGKHTGLIYRAAGFHSVLQSKPTKSIWYASRRWPIRNIDQFNNFHEKPDFWEHVPDDQKILRTERCKATKKNPTGLRKVWVPKIRKPLITPMGVIQPQFIGVAKKLRAALDRGDEFWKGREQERVSLNSTEAGRIILKTVADAENHSVLLIEDGKIGYVKDLERGLPYFDTPTIKRDSAEWVLRPTKV